VGLRIPKGESIVHPRSHCPKCQRTLTTLDLIPVLSYLMLRGKCRGCSLKISPIYPIIEVGTAALFTIAPLLVGWSKELLVAWTLISLLVIIFISDLHYSIIPNKVLLFFGGVLLVLRLIVSPLQPWWDPLLGAFLGFTLLLLISIVSKGGMGGGDIKLFAVIGLVLGWKGLLLAFFISNLCGTIMGLIGMMLGKVKRGKPFPFGPAIALGTLFTYFYGEQMIAWYIALITQ